MGLQFQFQAFFKVSEEFTLRINTVLSRRESLQTLSLNSINIKKIPRIFSVTQMYTLLLGRYLFICYNPWDKQRNRQCCSLSTVPAPKCFLKNSVSHFVDNLTRSFHLNTWCCTFELFCDSSVTNPLISSSFAFGQCSSCDQPFAKAHLQVKHC